MEKYTIPQDIKVFGVQVNTFPLGIQEAFDDLIKQFPQGDKRPYYGISYFTSDGMVYLATAGETYPGEAEQYHLQTFSIEKGDYLSETVLNWPQKTNSIHQVFEELVRDERCERTKPCVEIYSDMQEMKCLVKMASQENEMLKELESTTASLVSRFSEFPGLQVNTVPYEGGWTAAQVVQHVHKSDKGILAMLTGDTKTTERQPDQHAEQIKSDLSDLSIKMESPEFIVPASMNYEKDLLVSSLLRTRTRISEVMKSLPWSETCTSFTFPGYGQLTRIELISFIIHHTRRHLRQIEKIYKIIHHMNAKKIHKEIAIHASKEKIWQVLTEDQYTRDWYAEFSPGTHAITDWQVGSRALFIDDSNSGMISRVVENKPGEFLSLEYEGVVMNGIEDYEGDMAKSVKGGFENYSLTGQNGLAHLFIEADMAPEYFDTMSAAWDMALVKIKKMAEG